MAERKERVAIGMQFRSVIADCNALWKVVRHLGSGSWLCEVVNEPMVIHGKTYEGEHAGTQKAFLSREILGKVNEAAAREAYFAKGDAWYDQQPLGAILHYCDGGNNFIRCQVVMGTTRQEPNKRMKVLKPIAMVGDWQEWDLPKRQRDGSIYLRHVVQCIQDGSTWRPSVGCVWEYPECSYRTRSKDPRNLKPLDLSVPPMTAAEERQAALWRAVSAAKAALEEGDKQHEDPRVRLENAKRLIEAALR